MPFVRKARLERLEAAEEVCWRLSVMMQLCMIDGTGATSKERFENRSYLAEEFRNWSELAYRDGLLEDGDERPE